jgi:hypothetical protein
MVWEYPATYCLDRLLQYGWVWSAWSQQGSRVIEGSSFSQQTSGMVRQGSECRTLSEAYLLHPCSWMDWGHPSCRFCCIEFMYLRHSHVCHAAGWTGDDCGTPQKRPCTNRVRSCTEADKPVTSHIDENGKDVDIFAPGSTWSRCAGKDRTGGLISMRQHKLA